jgi:urease accessory protein
VRTLFQEGCLKLRLPRPALAEDAEVVVINTAGGLTGGDSISLEVLVDEEACATVTTPGSERIYRALEGEVVIEQKLTVRRRGRLDWLPQETILFDRARLRRRFDVQLEDGAGVTIAEAVLLGRAAMGETVKNGFLSDFWTVRRGSDMLFAEATRFADPFAETVGHAATLDGRTALATLIHVGADLGPKRDAIRANFTECGDAVAGASIVGDVLVARIAAAGIMPLRRALVPALAILRDGRPLPRLWTC